MADLKFDQKEDEEVSGGEIGKNPDDFDSVALSEKPKEEDEEGNPVAHQKMSIFQTSLALVATNIGGAILGLPYAFYHLGLINGIILNIMIAILAHISSTMYLKVKDLTPRRQESIYEIAYLLLGRKSIFIVCAVMFATNLAAMILYYIIIGDTISQLFAQLLLEDAVGKNHDDIKIELSNQPWWSQLISHRTTAILAVGGISFIFIFKRHLEELKSISYVFLTVVFLFIALLWVELYKDGGESMETYSEMTSIKTDFHLLTAISIFIFAYSFQFMVFPAYVELEKRSNSRFAKSSAIALTIYSVALILTGIVAVFLFGKALKPDLLDNLATKSSGVSVFLRTVYCFILLFHLPYIFFTLKEYTLVMYDEIMNKSLSTQLELKNREFEE